MDRGCYRLHRPGAVWMPEREAEFEVLDYSDTKNGFRRVS